MDIGIAGAGVAGLAAAKMLCDDGHRVVIYDKLPKPAPIGSGLIVQPTGQRILRAMGLETSLLERGARLDALSATALPSRRQVLDVQYSALGERVFGVGLHRAALFDILFQAAKAAGAQFEPAHDVTAVEDGRRLLFRGGARSPYFDIVIDAMGVRSPLAPHADHYLTYGALWTNTAWPNSLAFPSNRLTQQYLRSDVSSGVMPIGALEAGGPPLAAFFWTLRADRHENWQCQGLSRWKDNVLAFWPDAEPVVAEIRSQEQVVFARYAHHMAPSAIERNVVRLGDAWHAASPQLGQGANMALLDAFAFANALRASGERSTVFSLYEKTRKRHVQLYQLISRLFTPIYQSDARILPVLRDLFAGPVSRFSPMRKLLAAMVAGELSQSN